MNNPYIKTMAPLWRNEQRENVWVDDERLEEIASGLAAKELPVPSWDVLNVHPPGGCSLDEWLNYICIANVINFAFTNFQPPHKKFQVRYPKQAEKLQSGAFAMGACLMRAQEEGVPIFDPNFLSRLTRTEMLYVFRPLEEKQEFSLPLLTARQMMLQEAGRVLLKRYGGNWLNLFEAAAWRAFNGGEGVVERLTRDFPLAFQDVRDFRGNILEFHKRAQLLVMMYHDRALHSEGRFPLMRDAQDLGPPCDYELPHAGEHLGILRYKPDLKKRIKSQGIILENSREETEIRAATCYILTRMCELLDTWIGPVDYWLWKMGRESNTPHHLTPTTAY